MIHKEGGFGKVRTRGERRPGAYSQSMPALGEMEEAKKDRRGEGEGTDSGKSGDRDPCWPPQAPLLQDPLAPIHTLPPPTPTSRGNAPCELGISEDSDSSDPRLALHLHQLPQQVKRSVDHLPLAATYPTHYPYSKPVGMFLPPRSCR